ncbi:hypothetical protein Ocin01_19627, partial [Orchesella cincta]
QCFVRTCFSEAVTLCRCYDRRRNILRDCQINGREGYQRLKRKKDGLSRMKMMAFSQYNLSRVSLVQSLVKPRVAR